MELFFSAFFQTDRVKFPSEFSLYETAEKELSRV